MTKTIYTTAQAKADAIVAYGLKPCKFVDSENQTIREFARNLAMYAFNLYNRKMVDAIIEIIKDEENL